ncbi:MAG: phage major capsid protein [Methanothrix sp.]
MTDYDQYIGRSAELLPTEYSKQIIEALPTQSFCLQKMRQLPPVSSKVTRIPMLNSFPDAYFVDEVAGAYAAGNTKKTTKLDWTGVTMTMEEIAVIVPVPESVIADMATQNFDLWGMVKPRLVEALGVLVDRSVLYDSAGSIAPASWPDGIVVQAIAKTNTISMDDVGTGETFTDLADAILAHNGLFSLVEQDGYMVNGAMAGIPMMGRLRGLRSSDGQFLFLNDMKESTGYRLAGVPIGFPNNGAWSDATALALVGDWSQAVFGIRQDITWKVATEASIHDAAGALVYNLFQNDMVALRLTMRLGWVLPNPKNLVNETDGTRFPFAVLTPET